MRNSAKSFMQFYEASVAGEKDTAQAKKLLSEVIADFIHYTPAKLDLLESYLEAGQFDLLYQSVTDLKYLIEFSDEVSRYWYVVRGYSGALAKLKADLTVKGSKKIYSDYYNRYGDRRILRNEHWFEKKRWEFLDELNGVFSENELDHFMMKYNRILAEDLKVYISFVMLFIHDVKEIVEESELPEVVQTKNPRTFPEN